MRIDGRDYRQAKAHVTSATHRSRAPAQTLADFGRHMPTLGITRLANVTGLDCIGIPVFMAVRPNARSLAVAQGKGADSEHARASALMESVENWHAEWIARPARIASCWEMLDQAPSVDVASLPLRAGATLRRDLPMPWLEGFDLLAGQPVWVPYEYVTMNTLLHHSFQLTFFNSSNGLASGNHLLEAVLHGLLEVIERDALAQWGAEPGNSLPATRVDAESIAEPGCRALLQRFARAGVDVAVWDATSDLGVPTYACAISQRSARRGWHHPGVYRGFGCHLSPAVALDRALCEAAQSRLTVISGSRDDNPAEVYAAHGAPERTAALREAYFDGAGQVAFGARADLASASFEEDIGYLLAALRGAGLERVVVVDLTRPELGIPVVKVVVPGLGVGLHAPPGARARRAPARGRE